MTAGERDRAPSGELGAVVAELRANPHIVDVATSPLFDPDECARIFAECDDAAWRDSTPRTARSAPRRKADQPLPGGNHGWIGERIAARITELNDEVFGFRLVGLEDISVSSYDAESGGHIGTHGDVSPRHALRKLTFSVLLSDPATFEGGELSFSTGPLREARVPGTIALFPSFILHEVTPVTAGRRVAIVGWALGPTFV